MKFLFLVLIGLFFVPNVRADDGECADYFALESQKEVLTTFIDDAGEITKLLGSNWSGDFDHYKQEVSKMAQTYDVEISVRSSNSKSFSYYHLSILGPYEQVEQFLIAYYKKFFSGLTTAERARRIENVLNR